MSYSFTTSDTFSIIHARKLAAKVATDMHICAQYYGRPTEQEIRNYAEELAQYLNEGYIEQYEFGYKKDNKRIVSWRYKVDENGVLTADERPGNVVPYVDTSGAIFFNYLTQNSRFLQLSAAQQARFTDSLPVQRTSGDPPSDGLGYWISDRNYYSGGRGLNRQTFQPQS
jgi:Bacterial HORMA domain family 1